MIKVVAIVLFIAFGLALLIGIGSRPTIGFSNFTANGGFLPNGWRGVFMSMVFVIFSFIGTEVVAVTAGEAKDPKTAIPRAMRSMVGRLTLFYWERSLSLIGIVPWNQIQPARMLRRALRESVSADRCPAGRSRREFRGDHAAASSMNCNLYLVSRMLFSLARGGYAPVSLGRVSSRGTPVIALLVSTRAWRLRWSSRCFHRKRIRLSIRDLHFRGLFVWLMIFVTHLYFRPKWDAMGGPPLPVRTIGYPYTSLLGCAAIVAIIASTWWIEGMRVTITAGLHGSEC